jgi:DinB superfamily
VDRETRERLIERYAQGYDEVVAALEGAGERDLDAREAPGEWSPREVVHHLADSEMTSAIRLRRLIAEDEPEIVGYDQEEFARRLYYNRPIAASLAAFKYARESTTEILRLLTEEEWSRTGTHSESGFFSVRIWLEYYANHAHDHADQIRRARATVA